MFQYVTLKENTYSVLVRIDVIHGIIVTFLDPKDSFVNKPSKRFLKQVLFVRTSLLLNVLLCCRH